MIDVKYHDPIGGSVKTPRVKDETGKVVEECKKIADIFASSFANVFVNEPPTAMPYVVTLPSLNHLYFVDFSVDVICKKLKALKEGKSRDPDNITTRMLKSCSDLLVAPISTLCYQSFSSRIIPTNWKIALVTPVY